MKKNYIIAFALSFAILFLWDKMVVQPRRGTPPTPVSTPVSVPGERPPASPPLDRPAPPVVARESLVEFEIGRHRISINRAGGAVAQWSLDEGDRWLTLAPRKDMVRRSLAAFPDIAYDVRRDGSSLILTGSSADGLDVVKTLRVDPAGYLHRLQIDIRNSSSTAVNAGYAMGWGPGVEGGDEGDGKTAKEFQRAIAWDTHRVHKFKSATHSGSYAWWGVDGHYFLAAFIESPVQPITLSVDKEDHYYTLRRSIEAPLAPGQSREDTFQFYLGPKAFDTLRAPGLGLEKSVDFGFFSTFGRLIHRALFFFHKTTRNYGWSIIVLTILIQIVVLPLTIKSFQHGQRMKAIQPQMKRLQELHKGDPRRLNAEMMELYKRHGLRFMGMEGCVPILIQLPIFWALFSALRNTYELRQAPWIGWVRDLSSHDPFFVLPILMGAGMFFQQKMAMSSVDPSQRQIMYILPIVFTFIFLKMPSGLVLYWLTNSVLTIGIQLILMRRQARATRP